MPDRLDERPAQQLSGRFTQHVMGTVVSFDLQDPLPAASLTPVLGWLEHVDMVFSTYRHDSDISRLNRADCRLADCHSDVAAVLQLCAEASTTTDGYFTSMLAGRLDPSGLVKGWAIERASDLLRQAGSAHHVVNGGGDIQTAGTTTGGAPWRIGIADPFDRRRVVSIVAITDQAVATSGTAERGRHVLNPRTGQAAGHFASVSVICPRLIQADVMATAAMARGADALDWLAGMDDIEALAVTADGRITQTAGWQSSTPSQRKGGAQRSRIAGMP
jgi:FAD:protein FMN transferase